MGACCSDEEEKQANRNSNTQMSDYITNSQPIPSIQVREENTATVNSLPPSPPRSQNNLQQHSSSSSSSSSSPSGSSPRGILLSGNSTNAASSNSASPSRHNHHQAFSVGLEPIEQEDGAAANTNHQQNSFGINNAAINLEDAEDLDEFMPKTMSESAAGSGGEQNDYQNSNSNINNNRGGKKKSNSRQGSATSASSASPGVDAQAKFLSHVNGNSSNPVARAVFEKWLVFLHSVQKSASAASSPTRNDSLDVDELDDAFAGGASGGGVNNHLRTKRSHVTIGGADFGECDRLQQTADLTSIEFFATRGATEAVTHETVDETAQSFMIYLKSEIKRFGWVSEFSFDIAGLQNVGTLELTIKLFSFNRKDKELYDHPFTFTMAVKYHAIDLL